MSSDEIVRSLSHELSWHALDLRDLGDTDLPHSDEIPESPPQGGSPSSVAPVLSADRHRQVPQTPPASRSVAVDLVSLIRDIVSAELCVLGLGHRSRSRSTCQRHSRSPRHRHLRLHHRSRFRTHRDCRRSHRSCSQSPSLSPQRVLTPRRSSVDRSSRRPSGGPTERPPSEGGSLLGKFCLLLEAQGASLLLPGDPLWILAP